MTFKRVALVTGGNRGIGLEICRQLSESDITVILGARDSKKGQEATNQLKRNGHNVIFHPLDVVDPSSISNTKNYIQSEFGKLDILINNAAIFIDKERLSLDVDPEDMRITFETNWDIEWG